MTRPNLHVFTARMPIEEYEALRSYAFFANVSINEVVVRAIRELLRRDGREEAVNTLVEQARSKLRATLDEMQGE